MKHVTEHGEQRIRKRLKVKKANVDKQFGDALLKGRKHNEFKGRFKKFLDYKARVHEAMPIVYAGSIYWVRGGKLITAYPVPGQFRKYL